MQTNIVAGEGYSIIQLIGKLDSDTAAKVDAVFTETMASEHVLLLDFSKLKYISSEIFDLSGFTSMFTICADKASALLQISS